MIRKILIITVIFVSVAIVTAEKNPLKGTWCIGNQRLVIEFLNKDSIHITSRSDESINGHGTFTSQDSSFIATIINDDLELKMGYLYKMKDERRLKAKITFFTVDGDSVDHPDRWLRMEKCNPDKFDFEGAEEEDFYED